MAPPLSSTECWILAQSQINKLLLLNYCKFVHYLMVDSLDWHIRGDTDDNESAESHQRNTHVVPLHES